jgi:hypothetical protein
MLLVKTDRDPIDNLSYECDGVTVTFCEPDSARGIVPWHVEARARLDGRVARAPTLDELDERER